MPSLAVKPIVIVDALLRLGPETDDQQFQKAVSSCTLTPSNSSVTFQGAEPDAGFTFPGNTTWTLDITYAQDVESAVSLSRYLWDHQGEEVEFEFEPKKEGTSWAGTAIVVPGAVGGAVAAVATATVSLGVQGAPEPTFPVAPAETTTTVSTKATSTKS